MTDQYFNKEDIGISTNMISFILHEAKTMGKPRYVVVLCEFYVRLT
jgi:hypothetical protein